MLQLRGKGTGAMIQKHPFGDPGDPATNTVNLYLQKDLKLDLYKVQQISLVKALTKPEE
jgi:hypothetical protein